MRTQERCKRFGTCKEAIKHLCPNWIPECSRKKITQAVLDMFGFIRIIDIDPVDNPQYVMRTIKQIKLGTNFVQNLEMVMPISTYEFKLDRVDYAKGVAYYRLDE